MFPRFKIKTATIWGIPHFLTRPLQAKELTKLKPEDNVNTQLPNAAELISVLAVSNGFSTRESVSEPK